MKKKELPPTLSERLKKAIAEDLNEIYEDTCYNTYDYYSALETMRDCGSMALPRTNALIEEIKRMENDSFSRLHELWGLEKPFGLGNLNNR